MKDPDKYTDRVWTKGFRSMRRDHLKKLGDNDESWADVFNAYKPNLSDKEVRYLNLLGKMFSIEYNGDIEQMSLKERDIFSGEIPPSKYMGTRRFGFGNVARRFGEPFLSKIKLNAKVLDIADYNEGSKRNTVVTFVSNGRARKVAATTVLMTASLGVLKAGSINFSPSLPSYKKDVIGSMGFGTLNKCAMYWKSKDDMVWPMDKYWFELMKLDEASAGKWTSFYSPSKMKGTPTLIGWVGGDDARAIESQTNEKILDDVMQNLRLIFPSITRPDKVHITRWNQEEHVRGTYSFKAVGRDFTDDSAKLKKKVGRLWFAGEATAGDDRHASTVGAWRTGQDAAEDIVRTLKGKYASQK